MNSSERSEDTRSVTTKAEFLQKYFNLNYCDIKTSKKKYYNAITIRLNTHPSKKTGVTNEDLIFIALNKIVGENGIIIDYCWELTKTCQLHLHALSVSKDEIYRKDAISAVKSKYAALRNYSIYIESIKTKKEVGYWTQYLQKGGNKDIRPLYYRLCKFYHDPDLIVEDFEDLAHFDIEFNKTTQHFEYIDASKVRFLK